MRKSKKEQVSRRKEKSILQIVTEYLEQYKIDKLWSKANKNESDIKAINKATVDVLPTLNAMWDNPIFEPYRSHKK